MYGLDNEASCCAGLPLLADLHSSVSSQAAWRTSHGLQPPATCGSWHAALTALCLPSLPLCRPPATQAAARTSAGCMGARWATLPPTRRGGRRRRRRAATSSCTSRATSPQVRLFLCCNGSSEREGLGVQGLARGGVPGCMPSRESSCLGRAALPQLLEGQQAPEWLPRCTALFPAELIASMRAAVGGPPEAPPSDESELCSNWLSATEVGRAREGGRVLVLPWKAGGVCCNGTGKSVGPFAACAITHNWVQL